MTQSEYVKQRALGYEPRAVCPDAFFHFCEKIDALMEAPFDASVNNAAKQLILEMNKELLLPGKEVMSQWRPPDSGQSEDD